MDTNASLLWYVAHTRPRCEKRLARYCRSEGLAVTLPCSKSVKRYGRKTVCFEKPIFPGYIFFQSRPECIQRISRNEYTARLLFVDDQYTFQHQLGEILQAIKSGNLVIGFEEWSMGKEVRIVEGPLGGLSGNIVESARGATVMLRLDFIGKGAVVIVDRVKLELIN